MIQKKISHERMQDDSDYKLLENFVVGNSDLEELEIRLDKFNIFESIGYQLGIWRLY